MVRTARSIDELYRIAEDFKRLDIDVLGISGGDGTNHVTITGFINVYDGMALPHLAFLRGGTMNTVANSVGVPHGKPEGLLGRLIRSYASARLRAARQRRTPCHGASATNYGFLFGTGVVAGFLAEYYGDEEPSPLVAAKTLLRGIGSAVVRGEMIRRMAAPFRGSVELEDGTRWAERDYLAVAAGTIDQIGLNFRPFYRWAERPGHFHILGIHTSPVGFCRDLPRIWRAEPMRPGKTYESLETKVVVRGRSGSMRYMVDGDLHETQGELTLSIGPRVKLIVVK